MKPVLHILPSLHASPPSCELSAWQLAWAAWIPCKWGCTLPRTLLPTGGRGGQCLFVGRGPFLQYTYLQVWSCLIKLCNSCYFVTIVTIAGLCMCRCKHSVPGRFVFWKIKVWWHNATLFVYFFVFYDIHTFIESHSYNTFIRRQSPRSLSISSSLISSVGKPPCGAEPRIELGPALQQADALPTEKDNAVLGCWPPPSRTYTCSFEKTIPRRRTTVTSSLLEISTNQLGTTCRVVVVRGAGLGGVTPPAPTPFPH